MTDYAARIVRFDSGGAMPEDSRADLLDRRNALQGIFFSCATDAPGGFNETHLAQMKAL